MLNGIFSLFSKNFGENIHGSKPADRPCRGVKGSGKVHHGSWVTRHLHKRQIQSKMSSTSRHGKTDVSAPCDVGGNKHCNKKLTFFPLLPDIEQEGPGKPEIQECQSDRWHWFVCCTPFQVTLLAVIIHSRCLSTWFRCKRYKIYGQNRGNAEEYVHMMSSFPA